MKLLKHVVQTILGTLVILVSINTVGAIVTGALWLIIKHGEIVFLSAAAIIATAILLVAGHNLGRDIINHFQKKGDKS